MFPTIDIYNNQYHINIYNLYTAKGRILSLPLQKVIQPERMSENFYPNSLQTFDAYVCIYFAIKTLYLH